MLAQGNASGYDFAFRPGRADTTSAGAVRPRNSTKENQRPGGADTAKCANATQPVSAFQAFDSSWC